MLTVKADFLLTAGYYYVPRYAPRTKSAWQQEPLSNGCNITQCGKCTRSEYKAFGPALLLMQIGLVLMSQYNSVNLYQFSR